MLPRVSVIIPTLNEEAHLRACLDSILQADYPRELLEIIVVDNGSRDRTTEIARVYPVRLFEQQQANVAGLRNFGARQARGELLTFVDADCLVAPDWLRKAVSYYFDPKLVAWGGPPGVPESATWVQKTWFLVRQKRNPVEEVEWLESMNLFVRKGPFLQSGGFNEILHTCEDVDLGYRLHKYGKIIADQSIRVVHMGEAKSIFEFVRKEVWRGRSNLHGVRSHGLRVSELLSLSVPLYFALWLPACLLLSVLVQDAAWLLVAAVLYILPTILVLLKVFRKKLRPGVLDLFRLSTLLQFYFWARTVAVFRWSVR